MIPGILDNDISNNKENLFFTWAELCIHSARKEDYGLLKTFEYMATETTDSYMYSQEERNLLIRELLPIQNKATDLLVDMSLESQLYIQKLSCNDELIQDVLIKVVAAYTWRNKNAFIHHEDNQDFVLVTFPDISKLFSYKFFYKDDLKKLMNLIKISDTSTIFDDIDSTWIKLISPWHAVPIDRQIYHSPAFSDHIPSSPCNKLFSTYRIFKDSKEFFHYCYENPEQRMHYC